jgi:hypothetical protein
MNGRAHLKKKDKNFRSMDVECRTHLETEGKRIPFLISSSVMYDVRLHCNNKYILSKRSIVKRKGTMQEPLKTITA